MVDATKNYSPQSTISAPIDVQILAELRVMNILLQQAFNLPDDIVNTLRLEALQQIVIVQ